MLSIHWWSNLSSIDINVNAPIDINVNAPTDFIKSCSLAYYSFTIAGRLVAMGYSYSDTHLLAGMWEINLAQYLLDTFNNFTELFP